VGLWRSILRALGLSNDARVRISAPDIEVTLTGDPEKVRALLGVVRHELEKNPRFLVRSKGQRRGGRRGGGRATPSQVVQPTELDEMDSPYALPEAVVLPVPDEDVTDEKRRPRRLSALLPVAPSRLPPTEDPDTMLPPAFDEVPSEETISQMDTQNGVPAMPEEPDAEATAVAPNPSGSLPAVSRAARRPFVTDGGPTLMPTDSQTAAAPARVATRRDPSSGRR
jgi:hypothetical protein